MKKVKKNKINQSNSVNKIIKAELNNIRPSKEEMLFLEKKTREIVDILKSNMSKTKTSAEVFVGGSFAKGTIIKKDKYDIDIFIRFNNKYDEEEIQSSLAKLIPKPSEKIHGSRDYFRYKPKDANNLIFEIIPTLKIKNPQEAKNITDLSFFHVNYIKKKIQKDKNLANQIMLAKAFTHFQNCYGAESYINGFSGYALELLMVHYKTLENLLKAISKSENFKEDNKLIIDQEHFYKNQQDILISMNEAKLHSPIILIDPTFKERNVLAALSNETLEKMKQASQKFLKSPSQKFFQDKSEEEKKKIKEKYKNSLITIQLKTKKQPGDIAGTKLKKFSNYFLKEIARFLTIKASFFEYNEKTNLATLLLAQKPKLQILFPGPPIDMKDQMRRFKLEHKNIKIINKNNKQYAQATEKGYKTFKEYLDDFKIKNEKTIQSMDIEDILY